MRFARRLAVCVFAVLAMSVLAAKLWDQSDQATQAAHPSTEAVRPAQP